MVNKDCLSRGCYYECLCRGQLGRKQAIIFNAEQPPTYLNLLQIHLPSHKLVLYI
jgi:hypothetical protein